MNVLVNDYFARHKHGIQLAKETKVDGTVTLYAIYYYPEKPDVSMSLEKMDKIVEHYEVIRDYKRYSQFIGLMRKVYNNIKRLNDRQCLPISVVIDEPL